MLATSYSSASTSNSSTISLPDHPTFTLYGRVFDKDNGFTTYSQSVTVTNVLPTVVSTSPSTGGSFAGQNSMTVTFSEPVTTATATNSANYYLTGPSGVIPITSVTLDGTGKIATLSFATQTVPGSYSLRVGSISDLSGNVSASIHGYATADVYASSFGSEGEGFTTGDFNGDGLLDVIEGVGNLLVFWPGTSGGMLGTPSVIGSSASGFEDTIKSADLNHDGKLDLIVSDTNSGVSVFYGNGNGTFGARQTLPLPGGGGCYNLAVTDIDNDGDLDIIAGADGGIGEVTYLNNGGQFSTWSAAPYNDGVATDDVFAADLNGDGRKDLVATTFGNTSSVSLGSGSAGQFNFVSAFSAGNSSDHSALADIDGDGRLDLLSGGSGGQITYGIASSPYFGTTIQSLNLTSAYSYNIVAADLDGDGDQDVLMGPYGTRTIEIARNQGNRVFTHETISLPGSLTGDTFDLQVADLNADGYPDIIGTDIGNGDVFVLRSQLAAPVGTFSVAATVSSVTTSGNEISSGAGDLRAGKIVTFTATLNAAVSVSGTPSLTLNDGGTATYSGGSGTSALTFTYTVASGQNTADLAVMAFNSNGSTIKDAATGSIAADLSAIVVNPSGILQIDTTAPAAPGVSLTLDSGVSATDQITNSGALTLTGVETSALVEYSTNGGASWTTSFAASQGNDTVGVRQTDLAGNVSSTTSLSFTLDTTLPVASFSSTPSAVSTTDSASFFFSGSDPISGGVSSGIAALQFSVDGSAFATMTSPVSLSGLAVGSHVAQVRAIDNAGNVGSAVSFNWIVDLLRITSNGGSSNASVPVAENLSSVTQMTASGSFGSLSWSIVGGADSQQFAIDSVTGALAFVNPPDYEHPTDVDGDNSYQVTVQVSDGVLSATQQITVAVTPVNDNPPIITSDGGGATATISVPENTTAVTTVVASDADLPAQTLTYSKSGADAALFTIDPSTGILTFTNAPDYENPAHPDNNYHLTVTASDGTFTDNQDITVAVTPVNDNAPVIVSDGGAATASISVNENTTAVTTVQATDADLPAQTLTYSISGGADAAAFRIDSSSGALSFVNAPNFEAPTDANGDDVYDVTVQASDGSLTATQAIAVTVNDVNEPPTITSNGGGATAGISIPENSTAVTTVTAADPDAHTTLSYSLAGGADASKFQIDSVSGALSFIAAPNFEAPTDSDADNVYDVTVQVSDGELTASQAIAVTVTNVNEAPTIAAAASAAPSLVTGTSTTLSVLGDDVDTGERSLTYTWTTTGSPPASVSFSVNGSHAASTTTAMFAKAGEYRFLVTVTDPGGLTATSCVTVTVNQTLTSIVVTPGTNNLNAAATQQFSAIGYDQFGAAMATPPMFTWTTNVGTITGAGFLTAAQTSTLSGGFVTATSGSVSGTVSVVVTNHPPTIATPAAASKTTVTVGVSTNLSVLAADLDTGEGSLTYTWSLSGVTGPPPGMVTFTGAANGTNGAKNITAAFSVAGTYTLLVTVTDPGGQAVTSSVVVKVNGPPVFSTVTTLTSGTMSQSYTQTIVATGGTGPLTYALATGSSLPSGLTMSAAGVITGKPTTSGTYSFTITVTDSEGVSVSKLFSLVITTVAKPPGGVGGGK